MTTGRPPALPASLRARVLDDVKNDRRPAPRALAPWTVFLGSAVWVTLQTLAHARRANWAELPDAAAWVPLLELACAGVLSAVVAISQGAFLLGPKTSRALAVLAVPMAVAVTVVLLVPDLHPAPEGQALRRALGCDAGVMMVALPILALLLLGQRGRFLASPGLVGAVAGIAASTWGHAILHWGCPWTDPGHVLLGHVAPSIPLALVGAWLSRRLHRATLPEAR